MRFERKDLVRLPVLVLVSLLIAVNIKTFINTGGLYPGGFSGISILLQRVFLRFFHWDVPYSALNLAINLVPAYIAFRYVGKKFTIYSVVVIVLSSVYTDIIPQVVVTYDTLLVSIFGGIINAFAAGWALRMNASCGGTDFLAIYFSQKKGIDSWNFVLGVNVVILTCAGFVFGWDKAMYSVIYQFTSTQALKLFYRKYQKSTLFVVTNLPKEVCDVIRRVGNHSATILDGEGAYAHQGRKVVYSVVAAEECREITRQIELTDPHAFVNEIRTSQIAGNFYIPKEE